jgi:hypothetical protein
MQTTTRGHCTSIRHKRKRAEEEERKLGEGEGEKKVYNVLDQPSYLFCISTAVLYNQLDKIKNPKSI